MSIDPKCAFCNSPANYVLPITCSGQLNDADQRLVAMWKELSMELSNSNEDREKVAAFWRMHFPTFCLYHSTIENVQSSLSIAVWRMHERR